MRLSGFITALFLIFAGVGSALAQGGVFTGQSNGIPYATGGVGSDSREALSAKTGDFNLMVILALKDGHYLGGGDIAVRNEKGETVLEVHARGPWTFAKLPPGKYTVEAKVRDTTRSKHVKVAKSGLTRVHLIWDREPS